LRCCATCSRRDSIAEHPTRGMIPISMVHDDRDDKLGNTENESEGSANARLILYNDNVEGRTGCQDQSDKEEEQPMAEVGCMMYETPVSDAKFMMTVATAPAITVSDNVKAGEWPRSGWHMVDACRTQITRCE
jgi:hypothetical protein